MVWILARVDRCHNRLDSSSASTICVLADRDEKFRAVAEALHPEYRLWQILGNDIIDDVHVDAFVVDIELRDPCNVDEVRRILAAHKDAPRRLFIVERGVRLSIVQAYAIGATNIFFSPVDARALKYALRPEMAEQGTPPVSADAVARCSAAMGSMFAATIDGAPIQLADAESATDQVIDSIAGNGLSAWLDTVRRYHEGTFQHCMLVTGVAVDFAMSLGFSNADVKRLGLAATLHDVGKARIPVEILDKPGKLDDDERAIMQEHPAFGFEALQRVHGVSAEVLDAVRHHHEYLDGTGYPDGLRAAQIPDLVRLLTISDIFAALIEARSYKPPLPGRQAYEVLSEMDGKLEKALVAAFKTVAMRC